MAIRPNVSFITSVETKEKIKKLAEKKNLTTSKFLEILVLKGIKKK